MNAYFYRSRLGPMLALGTICLLFPATGHAGLLPIHFQPGGPIVSGSSGSLTYNAATGDFNLALSSTSLIFAAPFVQPNGFTTFSGSLSIDLSVDHSGHFVANGTGLQLTGTVTINGATFTGTAANPLLSGTITNFGSQPAGPPSLSFDGFFDITGGTLTTTQPGTSGQPVFGGFPAGGSGGFILTAENVTSGTLGDFSSDFSSSNVKGPVGVTTPEPSSGMLLLTAAATLGTWSLWRKRLSPGAIG